MAKQIITSILKVETTCDLQPGHSHWGKLCLTQVYFKQFWDEKSQLLLRSSTLFVSTHFMGVRVYTYIHTYIHVCMHACIHQYKHTYIQTYKHTYIHTNKHTYIHTYMCIHVHTWTDIRIYTHTRTSIHTWRCWHSHLCALHTCIEIPGYRCLQIDTSRFGSTHSCVLVFLVPLKLEQWNVAWWLNA